MHVKTTAWTAAALALALGAPVSAQLGGVTGRVGARGEASADTSGTIICRYAANETEQTCLGCTVGAHSRQPHTVADKTSREDEGSTTALQHRGNLCSSTEKCRSEIYRQHLCPLLRMDFGQRLHGSNPPGVVKGDIQASKLLTSS